MSCFGKEWNAIRKDSHAVRDESLLEPRSHSCGVRAARFHRASADDPATSVMSCIS